MDANWPQDEFLRIRAHESAAGHCIDEFRYHNTRPLPIHPPHPPSLQCALEVFRRQYYPSPLSRDVPFSSSFCRLQGSHVLLFWFCVGDFFELFYVVFGFWCFSCFKVSESLAPFSAFLFVMYILGCARGAVDMEELYWLWLKRGSGSFLGAMVVGSNPHIRRRGAGVCSFGNDIIVYLIFTDVSYGSPPLRAAF